MAANTTSSPSRRSTITRSHPGSISLNPLDRIPHSPPSPLSLATPKSLDADAPVHVVLKFGGTSVAKCMDTIVDKITPVVRSAGNQIPILVCSAQSYTIKTEGTTQCLLAAIDAALDPAVSAEPEYETIKVIRQIKVAAPVTPPPTPPQLGSPTVAAIDAPVPSVDQQQKVVELGARPAFGPRRIIEDILQRHLVGAKRVLGAKTEILEGLEKDLRADCERVIRILQAVSTFGEISPNVKDTVISFGELMACRTVVAALHSRDIPARLVDLTDLDKGLKRSAGIPNAVTHLDEQFFDELVGKIGDKIRSVEKTLPGEPHPVLVATGFFGPIPGSLLHHIGRGYTDVCAALCARAVAADELQIWKEVDGVFSADPRKILNAQLLKEISSDQAKLLTSYGSEVVHHLAINQTNVLDIPIIVKNVMNPTAPGTRIITGNTPSSSRSQTRAPSPVSDASEPTPTTAPPFAVTLINDLEMVNVHFGDSFGGHPTLRVMDVLREHLSDANNIGLDLVNSSQESVCFVVKGAGSRNAEYEAGLAKAVDALERIATVTTTPGLSYLQAVLGSEPQQNPAIAWKMFGALADAGISIKVISHGPVEYGIGCVIHQTEAPKAASVVHDALLQLLW